MRVIFMHGITESVGLYWNQRARAQSVYACLMILSPHALARCVGFGQGFTYVRTSQQAIAVIARWMCAHNIDNTSADSSDMASHELSLSFSGWFLCATQYKKNVFSVWRQANGVISAVRTFALHIGNICDGYERIRDRPGSNLACLGVLCVH